MSLIKIKNLTKTYGKKGQTFLALDSINFDIEEGTSLAIVGKSGSGKSTLMHAVSGLDRPEKGQIIIGGRNILELKKKEVDAFRNQTIGFIFQAFFIQPNETCYYNVELPLAIAKIDAGERDGLIKEALEKVGLLDKINQRAGSLSGGQKQRLAIARAIVNKPKIVFADEPTGNLDSQTGQVVEDLLFKLNKDQGVTLIIVTHDADLAGRCKSIVNIKDGKLVGKIGKSKKR
jgi:putative ABC transport system ATP-binding protein